MSALWLFNHMLLAYFCDAWSLVIGKADGRSPKSTPASGNFTKLRRVRTRRSYLATVCTVQLMLGDLQGFSVATHPNMQLLEVREKCRIDFWSSRVVFEVLAEVVGKDFGIYHGTVSLHTCNDKPARVASCYMPLSPSYSNKSPYQAGSPWRWVAASLVTNGILGQGVRQFQDFFSERFKTSQEGEARKLACYLPES